jgi:hypothetical protein
LISSASQRLTVLLSTLAIAFTIIVTAMARLPEPLMNSRILSRAAPTAATVSLSWADRRGAWPTLGFRDF